MCLLYENLMEFLLPSRHNANYLPPTDDDEFEDLLRDICTIEWGDENTKRYGRKGQSQCGVDVYGRPADSQVYRGTQCKLRSTKPLSNGDIEDEIKDAKTFPHRLDKLIIATSTPRDTKMQIFVDEISERETKAGGFGVEIWFWNDIVERIACYSRVMLKFYKDFVLGRMPIREDLVDLPLRIITAHRDQKSNLPLALRLRGICILTIEGSTTPTHPHRGLLSQSLHDGILLQVASKDMLGLERLASDLYALLFATEYDCPTFVVLDKAIKSEFMRCFSKIGGNCERITWLLTDDATLNQLADEIFHDVFKFGYERRGRLETIDILIRTIESKANGILDLDWPQNYLPELSEWEEYYTPALKTIADTLAKLGERVTVQIDSRVSLPMAFAVGFYFNIRKIYLGVWARRSGGSHFREQFWLSDGDSDMKKFSLNWIKAPQENALSAIVELTTNTSIHESIAKFVAREQLLPDVWLEIKLQDDLEPTTNVEESHAIAYVNQVAQEIRRLNEAGVSEIYLFARMPSALAVLIGQRILACGKIHLYWFKNPSYEYAFTLG